MQISTEILAPLHSRGWVVTAPCITNTHNCGGDTHRIRRQRWWTEKWNNFWSYHAGVSPDERGTESTSKLHFFFLSALREFLLINLLDSFATQCKNGAWCNLWNRRDREHGVDLTVVGRRSLEQTTENRFTRALYEWRSGCIEGSSPHIKIHWTRALASKSINCDQKS